MTLILAALLQLPAKLYARLQMAGVLALLLAASLAANTVQHYRARAAAADCTAAAEAQRAAIAQATAEAERLRAEQIGTLNLLLAEDGAQIRAQLERAQQLTRSAAAAYDAAQRTRPDTCIASAEHVRAVNAARNPKEFSNGRD